MDKRPIGVFDSGLGGLTAAKRLLEILPDERFVYLGDTLRVPYGDRPTEQIREFTLSDIDFLLEKGVKAVLIACGTATSSLSSEDFESVPVPIEGVLYPASVAAAKVAKNKKIGIVLRHLLARKIRGFQDIVKIVVNNKRALFAVNMQHSVNVKAM